MKGMIDLQRFAPWQAWPFVCGGAVRAVLHQMPPKHGKHRSDSVAQLSTVPVVMDQLKRFDCQMKRRNVSWRPRAEGHK